jgi:hypothetical protein
VASLPSPPVGSGFLGDDHNVEQDGSDLPAEVFEAFAGLDLIVYLGHKGVRDELARGVLDRLARRALVIAVQDVSTDIGGQPYVTPADGDRVRGLTRAVETGGLRIGLVHNLERPPGLRIEAPPGSVPDLIGPSFSEAIEAKFSGPVAVVAYAGTHRPVGALADGLLFCFANSVIPGRPTPYCRSCGLLTRAQREELRLAFSGEFAERSSSGS